MEGEWGNGDGESDKEEDQRENPLVYLRVGDLREESHFCFEVQRDHPEQMERYVSMLKGPQWNKSISLYEVYFIITLPSVSKENGIWCQKHSMYE